MTRLKFDFFSIFRGFKLNFKTDDMKTKSTFRNTSFFLSFIVLVFTGFVTLAGPGDPKHPELLSNPVISPSSLNSGDDVIISNTPEDQTNSEIVVSGYGWIYHLMGIQSGSVGGMRLSVSKDNGITFSDLYTFTSAGLSWYGLDLAVAGYDSASSKVFISGIRYEDATSGHNPFLYVVSGLDGSYIGQPFIFENGTDSVYTTSLVTDFGFPSLASSPYGVAMAYSKFGSPTDSLLIVTSVDGGGICSLPVFVASSTRFFGQISLAYGHSQSWSNGRLFLAAHEHDFGVENGNVRMFRTDAGFNDNVIVNLGYIDSLDTYTNGHVRNPTLSMQNNGTNNDSSGLSAALIFDCDIHGDGSDLDLNGFTSYDPVLGNFWSKTFADVSFGITLQPNLNFDPVNSNFLLTYFDSSASSLFFKYTNFNFGSGAVWNLIYSQYNDIPAPNAGTLLNPWPKVAIDPVFNQVVFSWRNETINGGACLFDAEFNTNQIDDVLNSDLTKLSLAPNPADREMTLNFTIEKSDNILLQMRNLAGQEIVLNQNLQAITGENSLQLDVSSFASGIYSLSIITSKGSFNQKIVLSH